MSDVYWASEEQQQEQRRASPDRYRILCTGRWILTNSGSTFLRMLYARLSAGICTSMAKLSAERGKNRLEYLQKPRHHLVQVCHLLDAQHD